MLFFPFARPARAQKVVSLTDSVTEYHIGKYTDILLDPTRTLTIDSVAFGSASRRFRQSNSTKNNFNLTTDAVWVRFTVQTKPDLPLLEKNGSQKTLTWLITPNQALIDKVSFYTPSSTNGTFSEMKAGVAYPMAERVIQKRLIVFPFQLRTSEQKTFYMRFESEFSLPVNMKLWKPAAFADSEADRNLRFGVFYGALLIMAFYNLFLFFSVKDLSYLYYSLYAISVCFYQSCLDGFYFQFLTPNNIWINEHIFTALAGFTFLFWMLFVREFLQVPKYSITLDRFYKIMIGILIAYVAILTPVSVILSGSLFFLLIISSNIVLLTSGVYCVIKGNRNARFYLAATLIFLFGFFSQQLGIEHGTLFGERTLQIGAVGIILQMTFFSFALGNRFNTIKRDKEREKALIRSRIAGDLHDEIGSNLSSISIASQMIKKNSSLQEIEKSRLEDITVTAKETADSIRDIIWFINPEHDTTSDLILKMRGTAKRLLQGIEYTFDSSGSNYRKSNDVQFHRDLFLIFKESLHNIVKHSKADQVHITVVQNSRKFHLTIVDNGIGFDEKNINQFHGEGIKNLRKRTHEIQGDLNISSELGRGTTVSLMLKA